MNPYVQYMYSYPHKTAYRPLAGVRLQEYAQLLAGGGHGLYLHIPFCQAKCGYCNLFSVTGQSEDAMDRYLDAVERQCRQYRQVLKPVGAGFSELVIGGGTPLLLTERQLDRMFGMLGQKKEIVIETAPNQTTKEKLALLRQAGVTRVSMGIQSFSDRELRAVGRQHDASRAREALGMLREAGFPCVNVDFIYGIPGQTVESLLGSLREALRYEPDEIFLYPLYVRHGAGLVRAGIVPDAETAYRQYCEASAFLRQEGYRQDSMRRFVRQKGAGRGAASESALRDAAGREFSECGFGNSLALGCGGRSYLGRLHFCSPYAITQETCLAQLRAYEATEDFTEITHGFVLSDEEIRRRYVIRHLLIRPGIDIAQYEEVFHASVFADFPLLWRWREQGYLEILKGDGMGHSYVSLTEEGLGFSDYLGPQLISDEVRKAMLEWERMQESGASKV